uniref:Nucleolar pre-ribosomal-associated protein 1 N-terminal domain-containing protein n=1 Tax=Oryza meridionalis TaxID=40149 RepID=A0A0E0DIM3_9ORYZ
MGSTADVGGEDELEIVQEDLYLDDDDEHFDVDLNEDDEVEEAEPKREQNLVKVGMEAWNQSFGATYKVRLIHILKNLHTAEIKIYSDASREFIELLDGDPEGEVLRVYVQQSPRLVELAEAWRLHREKPGMSYILSLFATVLGHPGGKLRRHGLVKKSLDGVARMILEDKEKMGDVYLELNSGEFRRQNAALDLLAAIVRRGGGLASEIAKSFDFKMAVLPQLSGVRKKRGGRDGGNWKKGTDFGSTRRSFVGFAMSFLEVGNPKMLRWILQQRELYSGVLRGIGDDDTDTIVYILSTLRNNVLVDESLVPPGLRSVLFGSATLEQLSLISGNLDAGEAADIAHEVLVMVCTDPKNGLMPNSNLRGNQKRLLDLMKKLKATEIVHHKNLLLAIVSKSLSLCSAYMNEFPYSIEPRPSSSWFSAISLAADMISSVKCDGIFQNLLSTSHDLVSVDDEQVQVLLKCIVPNMCTRAVINRGLLHSDDLVKHGALRLVFESVNLLCDVIEVINDIVSNARVKSEHDNSTKVTVKIDGFPGLSCSTSADASIIHEVLHGDKMHVDRWITLREYIQDVVRGAIPDPQVLLKLLSSACQKHQNYSQSKQKKHAQLEPPRKKRRHGATDEDADIIIGGIDVELSRDEPEEQEMDLANDHTTILCEIWGLNKQDPKIKDAKVVGDVFHSKLLDVLRFYLRVMPSSFDGSFDFFKVMPPNPLDLSMDEQQSLLSLLVEYSGQSDGYWCPEKVPESMYKYLQPLIDIMLHSQVKSIRDKAYILVKAALASSGAFDQNFAEIDAWLAFLPCYKAKGCEREGLGVEASNKLSHIVTPFLCDAISVVGNNLYKYQEHIRKLISKSNQFEGYSPSFSPLIVCVLQKCLRLLDSESASVKLHEKSTISLYVCNTVYLIMQSQVDVLLLPDLVGTILNERLSKFSSEEINSRICFAEWRPLMYLLHILRSISDQKSSSLFSTLEHSSEVYANSLCSVTRTIEEMSNQQPTNLPDDVATSFLYSVICAPPDDVISSFPKLLHVLKTHFPFNLPFLSSVLFLQHDYLAKVASYCPDMFFSSLRQIKGNLDVDSVNIVEDKWGKHSTCSESAAISTFLNVTPFCALLPSVLSLAFSAPDEITKAHPLLQDELVHLLQAKISESPLSELTIFLRVVLFWSHHLLSSYTVKCSDILAQLCGVCFSLIDSIFERIRVLTADTANSKSSVAFYPVECLNGIVESVVQHPIIGLSLSCSLSNFQDLADGSVEYVKEDFATFSKEKLHLADSFVLNLLSNLYGLVLLAGSFGANYSNNDDQSLESLFGPPKLLLERILLLFKEKFELCMEKRNFGLFLPNFYMFRTLAKFVSPVRLLELANWMFSTFEGFSSSSPAYAPAAFFCLYTADIAFEMLYDYLQQVDQRSGPCRLWGLEIHNCDIATIQQVYNIILHFATKLNLEFADLCLLKMLIRIHHTEISAVRNTDYIALHMMLSTMVANTPIDILHHCMFPTSKVKAKAIQLLLGANPMHMRLFGKLLTDILKKDTSVMQVVGSDSNASWTHEDCFILLLPAALSYIEHHSGGNRQCVDFLEPVPVFYREILLSGNGFPCWKSFVTRSIFEEDFSDFRHTSVEDIMNYFGDTLLGKSITMLRYYFCSKEIPRKQRLKIIASICPQSSELLDSDISFVTPVSCNGIMKLTNELFAKISLIRMLLSPPRGSLNNEIAPEKESKRVNNAKLSFISILVRTLDKIFRNFPHSDGILLSSPEEQNVISCLEYAILKNIIELSSEVQSHLNQLKPIPFLNQLIRSSLLHRFSDPVVIKAIRCILVVLSEGKFPADEILELILGHSHFVSTITCSGVSECPSACNPTGGLLQPAPSILKSVDSAFAKENKFQDCIPERRKVEIIRLLRVLYDIKSRQHNSSLLDESRELGFLLLSVYGATLSETDLEILHLMNEIESSECKAITDVDHLWGKAAVKFREELKLEFSASDTHKMENAEISDRRRSLFRENIPIDSKLCVMTALQFCYRRSSRASISSLEQLQQDNFGDIFKATSQSMDVVRIYDPVFILRFSIHTLLMGYIEPVEFSRLGLLAITLVSISSPDEDLRKLGYESLGKFKKSLEASQKSKETWQLQLLLTYLQNGISEQWQRIPSVIAIFAAEASLTLLDSSHTQFATISKFLMHSASVNLQLLYAGSNLADDAKIYKRGGVLELALSYGSSAVSDSETKLLTLQVVNDLTSSRLIAEWLQETALEQLSRISKYLYVLVEDMKLLKGNVPLLTSVLNVIASTMRLSMKRKIYQPHFSLSLHGIHKLCRTIGGISRSIEVKLAMQLGIDVILMNGPLPVLSEMDKSMTATVVSWATSNIFWLCDEQRSVLKMPHEEPLKNECLLSKMLRWLVASIILGKISCISHEKCGDLTRDANNFGSLESFLNYTYDEKVETVGSHSADEALAIIILYLQKHLKMNRDFLPSVVAALCLLLLDRSTKLGLTCARLANALHSYFYNLLKQLLETSLAIMDKSKCCAHRYNVRLKLILHGDGSNHVYSPRHYYQPWKDPAMHRNEAEHLEEEQACQSLLVIFSNSFSAGLSGFPVLSLGDVEKSGLFQWERDSMLK